MIDGFDITIDGVKIAVRVDRFSSRQRVLTDPSSLEEYIYAFMGGQGTFKDVDRIMRGVV